MSAIGKIFPPFNAPRGLKVADLAGRSWHERVLLTSLQGLVNRTEPRIYLIHDEYDERWLDYYRDRFGLAYEPVADPMTLMEMFGGELEGYIVYDDEMLHTANVAGTMGGLRNAVPVSPGLEGRLLEHGLKKIEDLRGRWGDRCKAYEWAFERLWPQCTHRILGSLCVDLPYGHDAHPLRDYLIANRAFLFDLSSSYRERREYQLYDRILEAGEPLGVVMGWHCGRDQEKEAVARAAKKGFFVLCSVSSPNLTVHAGIPAEREGYVQRTLDDEEVALEKKVYISFYCTDGDAIWAMRNFQSGNWLSSKRGTFPFNWGFLPLLVELAPGMLQYYYETRTPNDYFMCPSSGAGYTYSFLHPDAEGYLAYSRHYLQRTGYITANMVNWDTNVWWREVEDPEAMEREKVLLSNCIGLVCGLGGSAFATSYLGGRIPKVHSAMIAHAGSDVAQEVRSFVACTRFRPLFLFIFAQIGEGVVETLAKAASALGSDAEYEILHMDDFMLRLKKALDRGWIGELYPEKDALRTFQLVEPGQRDWEGARRALEELTRLCSLPEEDLFVGLNEGPWDQLAAIPPGRLASRWEQLRATNRGWVRYRREDMADVLGYDLFYTAWAVVRAALNLKGIYANHRDQCLTDFMRLFEDIPDVGVLEEIWATWREWEARTLDLDRVKSLVQRTGEVTQRLKARLGVRE